MSQPRLCVYTVLIGGYERLNEQPVARASDVDFLCFTDDPGLTSETWQVRHAPRLFAEDPTRSARALKIRPHAVVPEYEISLYVDNSVQLLRPPESVVADLLPDGAAFALFEHGYRGSVRDEFAAVAEAALDSPSRLDEQLAHYSAADPGALELRPLKGFLLLRRHHDPAVVAAMEIWLAHVLRYSRRDQLSLWVALREAGLEPLVHRFDNFESPYHRWPVIVDRLRRREWTAWAPPERRLAELQTALAERTLEVEHLEQQLRGIEETRSWRWTAPARALVQLLH